MWAEAEFGAYHAASLVMIAVAEELADFFALESDGVETAIFHFVVCQSLF